MKRVGIILILVTSWCGCRTYTPTPQQTDLANHLTEMIAARDSMARYYNDGHEALQVLLEDRNEKARLTFRKNVHWSRLPVSEIEGLLVEVDKQIDLIKADLTTHPKDFKKPRNANNEVEAIRR